MMRRDCLKTSLEAPLSIPTGFWGRGIETKTGRTVSGVLKENPLSHCFVLRAVNDVKYEPAGIHFAAGDEIECYEDFKQSPAIMRQ
jgi:hypothetical protein